MPPSILKRYQTAQANLNIMDDFINEVRHTLQQNASDLQVSVEPQVKSLASKSFMCMSRCYKEPDLSIQDAQSCADQCQQYLSQVSNEIQQHLNLVQNSFQLCTEKCGLTMSENVPLLKECIQKCVFTAQEDFTLAKQNLRTVLSKYQQDPILEDQRS